MKRSAGTTVDRPKERGESAPEQSRRTAGGPRNTPSRILSVDIVRGLVMVLMALDHVRDWTTNVRFQPEDLSRSSAALFATRWVTHICAPTFFLLAGLGIGILMQRRVPPGGMSRYLITRGFWLLVLELVITPIGWQFGLRLVPAFALVLWALGWSMIVMAALVHAPRVVVAALSLLMIFGHNLLDPIRPDTLGAFRALWHMLHAPGFMVPNVLFIAYPLVPWVGVMALGYVLAAAYQWDANRRRRLLVTCGIAAVAMFVVLRALNWYGNPFPWSPQRTTALTIASFLNVLKYPPSLHFLLMTLGPALIALALAERARGRIAAWLSVYGRVPLFFYVAHIFVAHAVAVALALVQGGELRRIPVVTNPGSIPPWFGLPLPGVYLSWILVVALMYFPCRRVARLKAARSEWWIRYM
jgi:uncharacterized membrane protein